MQLNELALFRQQAFIAGKWCDADHQQTSKILNPATLEIIGTVPNMGKAEAERAIEAAKDAWPLWKNKTAKDRSIILKKWFDLIISNADELAFILTSEQGKPLAEAKGEILYAASFIEWFAEEAKRVYGDIIPSPYPDARIVVNKQPIGVVAAITPWNFPAAMITRKVAPALAAGCPCIVKPAPETPFTALALVDLALQAGVPAEIFSVITGDAVHIGDAIFESDVVRKFTFTGSTPVGKMLLERSAKTLKKVSLELGGNAPFIVFDDADLDAAIEGALIAKFRNAGQTCVCVNRFLVQAGIYEKFIAAISQKIQNFNIGNGLEAGHDIGPLINANAVKKVEAHIQDALDKNGRLVIGGKRHTAGELFFEPTLIADVTADMDVATQETFGPLAAVFKFETEQQAVEMANATEFGLAAYCYTKDLGRAWRMSEQLEYGMVGINKGLISNEVAPFGGIKQSGLGREGSKYGIEDYLEIKYTLFGGLNI
ncbi:TPA: NAD-dependent succinate-semialdehyde dehydrogenase [Acinetobacter baumannii]|uniref:Succinate-semialdehyde dehydrogenase [NAD(P)+] n=2 Tax=Acinetobacter baumannii (strain ATCC 19606 / DSM 30007 / JCM 6841 / CCUG 19606 / CIP 70.34 / NBRC 109757 / NCIMB 12457 / NCTC 12156 / 81) TaxID=575584 RepID=D0C8G7_ACIB2|nr:NAD-dependent succinate-semialdehyde dehydrogenase [Acinetobacter baumannii]ARN31218.1 succinate-semialdehyde dehydrogenase (NADP(+)) [Acinetobacter baumannii]EEX05282.1 succinate-semialdehyde dehydrogenase [NAD(P)+] [Acinetobacter baumannii ATCC 19606 = CIP 70.34 = JCM 6841]EHU1903399.1 NAD-dependent succinate-semialdehyde dehydrogenase [Acinetobacter baumannii]EHU1920620.1 NAD-dependent succinate-semialdehyde dehydrogenase [Acinetobacter baumannii]EHU1965284.1 NAD-dependent succinate-semi